jgi:hypothetical protein
VSSPRPEEVFKHDLKAAHASQPMAPWLLLIAALLLPFDIAVRRLIITKHDLVLFQEWIAQRLPALRHASRQGEVKQTPQMEALFNAKSRVRENQPMKVEAPAKSTGEPVLPTIETKQTPKETPSKQETPASTTSALLARKKNIKK